MSSPELVIFDCDGVLVDSEIIAARVEAELLTKAGFAISPEEIAETYAGLTFKDIMLTIEAKAGIPFQASMIDQAEDLVDRRLAKDLRAIEGVHQAVGSITGLRCVASNSRLERLEAMLTKVQLKPFFGDKIFSAPSIPSKKTKPEPDVFLYAAEQMGVKPERAFVIEDSVHGVTAAKRAGMRVIGFTGASHTCLLYTSPSPRD